MMNDTQLELYGFGVNDRSGKVRWLAHELGLEVTEHRISLGEQRNEDYRAVNPYACVPTVIWQGRTLTESTATCLYLAESFPESGLAVFAKDKERFEYLRWLALFGESFEGRLVDYFLAGVGILPESLRDGYEDILRFKLGVLVKELPDHGFLVGDRLTVADILACYSLRLAISGGLISFADVKGYLRPFMMRPAAEASGFFSSLTNLLEDD